MLKFLGIFLVCFMLAGTSFAQVIGGVIIHNPDGDAVITRGVGTGISVDTVGVKKYFAPLGKSLDIYSVQIAIDEENIGQPRIYVCSAEATGIMVTGTPIRINTDNLSDVYISGVTDTNDLYKVRFVAETR